MVTTTTFASARGRVLGIVFSLCAVLGLGAHAPVTTASQPDQLPKVVLLGDSIRLGYAPVVERELAGKALVLSPKANGGDSSNLLKHLEEWALRAQPVIVHFNCGIHDTKKSKANGKFQVSPEQYEANLRKIVERIRQGSKATVLFATTTPILDERAARGRAKAGYELLGASVEQYNEIAKKTMQNLKVPVNNLHGLFTDPDRRGKLISGDGVHFTAEGREVLGKAVAAFILKQLPGVRK